MCFFFEDTQTVHSMSGEINDSLRRVLERNGQVQHEDHYSVHCNFEKLSNWYITGTNIKVWILIRLCFCGKKHNAEMLKRGSIRFDEFVDGVELHLSDTCRYVPKNIIDGKRTYFKLEKKCSCGKEL